MGVGQLGEMSRVILCGSATTRVRRGSSAIALLALLLALTCGTAAAAAEAPVNTKVPTISGSGSAKEGKVLTANPGKWSGTVETYSYQWQRCTSPSACANIPSATNIEYTPQSTDVGYTLLVSVVAHGPGGPSGESKPALSAQTSEVAGVAPKNTKALEIVGKVENGQPLEVINSQEDWSGTPATKFTYLWESCGAKKECKAAEGPDASTTYRPGTGEQERKETLRVLVTDINPAGSATATPTTAIVAAGPPVDLEAPSIIGAPREGHSLSATTGTWVGSPTIFYMYAWSSCTPLTGCIPTGATGSTYTPGSMQVGETIEVTVTALNLAAGSAAATSAPTGPVLGPPRNTTPPTIAGNAREGETLTIQGDQWAGTQPIALSYTWEDCTTEGERKCIAIEGVSHEASSYKVAAGDVGDVIQVTVTASNSVEPVRATSPATAVVTGGPPQEKVPPTITGKALEGETLAIEGNVWAGEEPITLTDKWERCSAQVCAVTGEGLTYTLTHADVGSTLRLTVTATNKDKTVTAEPSAASAEVKLNGKAVTWGENYHAQLGQLYRDTWELSPVPVEGVSEITQMAAGGSLDLALLANGTVRAWGGNHGGQNGDDNALAAWEQGKTNVTVDEFKNNNENEVAELTGVTQVATADEHAMALIGNGPLKGTVKAWGGNEYGQLGDGKQGEERQTDVNEQAARSVQWLEGGTTHELTNIKAIAAGGASDYALTENGEIWAWGSDVYGQLGVTFPFPEENGKLGEHCHTNTAHTPKFEGCSMFPRKVMLANGEVLKGATAIYAGSDSAYALMPGGKVMAWGLDNEGQLGVALKENEHEPGGETVHSKYTPPAYVESQNFQEPKSRHELENVVELAPGFNTVLARLQNGQVLGWGSAENDALTFAEPPPSEHPTTEPGPFKIGQPYAEYNCNRSVTQKNEELKRSQLKEKLAGQEAVLGEDQAKLGPAMKLHEADEAKVKEAGKTPEQQLAAEEAEKAAAATVKQDHTLVEKAGKAVARTKAKLPKQPNGEEGELTSASFCMKRATPIERLGPAGLGAEKLSAANRYGLAVAKGKVYAWGSNSHGQLGQGTQPGGQEGPNNTVTPDSDLAAPTEVPELSGAVAVYAATESHATALFKGESAMTPHTVLTAKALKHTAQQPPAMALEWQQWPKASGNGEKVEPTMIRYQLSELKGEAGAEEGSGEGPPRNLLAPTIEVNEEPLNEAPVVGEKLLATKGEWAGARSTFEYHWSRCPASTPCEGYARWEAQLFEGSKGQLKSPGTTFEVTSAELLKLQEEKVPRKTTEEAGWQWTERPATLPGHTVKTVDVGDTLEVEVVAKNGEQTAQEEEEELNVALAPPTRVVFPTELAREEAHESNEEEAGEKFTGANCRVDPEVPFCTSGFRIESTITHPLIPGTKKRETVAKALQAEPYEFKFETTESDGRSNNRVMVVQPFGAPAITSQPASTKVAAGMNATFKAASSGGPRPTAQWEVSTNGGTSWSALSNGGNISGAGTSSLVVTAQKTESGNEYRAVFTNSEGPPATTNAATLTVE